jgi:radical SAM protein with 4Fe4S-binding SPASM domain
MTVWVPVPLQPTPGAGGTGYDLDNEAVRPPLPTELQVEITGACNLRCHMCLVRYRPPINRVQGSLRFDDFTRLVDALPGLRRLTLQGLGEPLLHPDLVRMVAYAAGRGIRVGFNSNATLLTERTAARLIEAGLGWLHVSVDGATAATYERIRDGASFGTLCRNVRRLVTTKDRLGADRPDLRVVFVAMRDNVAELPDVVRLADEWGIGQVRVQNLSHSFDDCDPSGSYEEIRTFAAEQALWGAADRARTQAAFDEAAAEAVRLGIDLRLPPLDDLGTGEDGRRRPGEAGCFWPWDGAYVTHEGTVQPCCMVMGSDRVALGDVRAEDFAEIWHNPGYQRFRAALLTDKPPAVCRGCSLYRGVF